MKPSKIERQARLLQLVSNQVLSTQSELAEALNAAGMEVTQATVSRDIKELGITKVTNADGRLCYTAMDRSGNRSSERLMNVFSEAVISLTPAGTLVVVRTLPGMAQAAAAALDSMRLIEVVGSIAGDDTIFVAAHSVAEAELLANRLSRAAAREHPLTDQAK